MDKENTGCFAWIVSFKQSCNERWARFRNRIRRRFYARRGQAIDPSTIVNETGTKDMVISKTVSKTIKVLPERYDTPRATEKECPVDVGSAPATRVNGDFENLVQDYVSCIITKTADTLRMERQASLGNQNAIVENSADKVSLSPSDISQIADIDVEESLTNILLESDINQSAIHKTIKEVTMLRSLRQLTVKILAVNELADYTC